MSEPLNVIALISGGKDSFYSILHCLQNGHKVVALGNLYPPARYQESHVTPGGEVDEHDLNSFMYQTVGHTVIPLYEQALGVPLYRQQILGSAVHTGTSYQPSAAGQDETESLVPLLKTIVAAHPEANALSTGAILSTYQRTRVESVAGRLGLVPLSFLWQYPILPPGKQTLLLEDMGEVGLDARVIKVASGGLDESFLWANVASGEGMRRIEKAMARFGVDDNGAVLGEGGEFETLVLDGPTNLFKRRIVVKAEDMRVVREGGGTAWLSIQKAAVEMKEGLGGRFIEHQTHARVPNLFESRFWESALILMDPLDARPSPSINYSNEEEVLLSLQTTITSSIGGENSQNWTVLASRDFENDIEQEAGDIINQIAITFKERDVEACDIYFTLIVLRSMKDFTTVNKIYGAMFTEPNPPARVTIACGAVLPPRNNIIIQLHISRPDMRPLRKALHVQSRSYWAPANIGPYSQAQSVPLLGSSSSKSLVSIVHVAGQIPLIPNTMKLMDGSHSLSIEGGAPDSLEVFKYQTLLSLQHLWRVGKAMDVSWWTAAVAYLSRDGYAKIPQKVRIAAIVWGQQNELTKPSDQTDDNMFDESDEPDLWEERHHGGILSRGSHKTLKELPDWSIHGPQDILTIGAPPFFAAEVEELPRGSEIEWHALLGLTSGPITVHSYNAPGIGTCHTCRVTDHGSQTLVMLPHRPEIFDLAETLDLLLAKMETPPQQAKRKDATGYYCNSHAAYLDVCVKGLWDADAFGGVVPCRSLWDRDGERLTAVLVFQSLA